MKDHDSKNGVSVRAHKGDAMTLLAFDLDESKTSNFAGFSIRITAGKRKPYFLFNMLTFPPATLKKNGISKEDAMSTEFSPIQKFRWVHVPATYHQITKPFYGTYVYEVTPRYLVDGVLQPLDKALTVAVSIDVSPYRSGELQIGFTRGFVASQAYVHHFGNNNKVRPNKKDLIFDVKGKSGTVKSKDKTGNDVTEDYSFADQFEWMGWQARARILEFFDDLDRDQSLTLDVFAFDLDEPSICERLIALASKGRLRIVLDDSSTHTGKDSAGNAAFEDQFETLFKKTAKAPSMIVRGHYQSLAHSKVFIQRKGLGGEAVKVLTGSTNFSTNGLYINANHVLIFDNPSVAGLYASAFDQSLSKAAMSSFKTTTLAEDDNKVDQSALPPMTIRFSPHTKETATAFFKAISKRIEGAESDVLFAIMKDDSESSILSAIKSVRENSTNIFSYGVTDASKSVTLYKPHKKNGVRVTGKGGTHVLPPPFDKEVPIPGIAIHHKFVVVDFKGKNPVVWCGSSNLAFSPEQKNGDNLIEIRDPAAVTAFAIEAIRLVDHFHFRDRTQTKESIYLEAKALKKPWHASYYDKDDLHSLERTLLISGT